jgi:multidrug efflux pump subunit AcrA (membrane-fusion protein)
MTDKTKAPAGEGECEGHAGTLHGCLTGDCPHNQSKDCLDALSQEIARLMQCHGNQSAALARAEAENARAAEEGFKIAARLTARVEEAEARAARAEGEVKRTKTHGPHSNPATCPSWNDWCNCGSDNLDAILAVVREEAARGAEARAARAEGERDLACKAFGMAREQRNEALDRIESLEAALAAATARAERYREALEAVAAHNDTDRCCDQKQAEATRCAICWPRYVAVRALASGAEGRE